jgi:flagellar biosynthesis/type III secretory pathway protein FliH
VKLINFAEELFNCEVKNVTDLMAEHEIGFAEGKKEGHAEGFAEGKNEGHEAGLAEGRAEGFAQGKTEGFAEGKTEGREAGLAEGELKKAREMAAKMLAKNKPIEEIMEFTGLPEPEILAVKSRILL